MSAYRFELSPRCLNNLTSVAAECEDYLSSTRGGDLAVAAAANVARELVDKNVVAAVVQLKKDTGVLDAILQLLLRQMTNQAPPSLALALSSESQSILLRSSTSNNMTMMDLHLPPGVEHMSALIALNAVSQHGSAVTILKLLDAPATRRTALALLAKVAEGCIWEFRRSRNVPERVSFYDTEELKRAVREIAATDSANFMYECKFISQCFGWGASSTAGGFFQQLLKRNNATAAINVLSSIGTMITARESLTLVRRPHRVPCYSILAVPHQQQQTSGRDIMSSSSSSASSLSLVATCGRDAASIDVFRDVGINQDYALSSFSVPAHSFAPLSLVGASARGDTMIALCCGVEVSEKVGIGVVQLHDTSASAQCEVREVYGISSPTCAVPVSVSGGSGPAVAVGCCVPGGYGISTVAVETTQRLHTIANSHQDTVTCLESLFGGNVVASAWRDGAVDLWDLRRNPRGPCLTLFGGSHAVTTSMRLVNSSGNTNHHDAGGGDSSSPLLITGGFDGLLRLWDLRAMPPPPDGGLGGGAAAANNNDSSSSGNLGRPLLDGALTSLRLDGPILSIAAIPSERTGAHLAVSTTRSLSLLQFNQENGSGSALSLNQVVPNKYVTAASGNAGSLVMLSASSAQLSSSVTSPNAASVSSAKNMNSKGNNAAASASRIPLASDSTTGIDASLLSSDDTTSLLLGSVLAAPASTTTTTPVRVVPNVYHHLCFVENFAGTDDVYLLAGSEVGSIEAFCFRDILLA